MKEKGVFERLAEHLSKLCMGYPPREDLIDILKENFSDKEAEVALALPTGVIPLQPVGVEEIREGIGRLGGCRVALIHLPDEVAAALAADPIPRVVAGYDGMVLSLDSD